MHIYRFFFTCSCFQVCFIFFYYISSTNVIGIQRLRLPQNNAQFTAMYLFMPLYNHTTLMPDKVRFPMTMCTQSCIQICILPSQTSIALLYCLEFYRRCLNNHFKSCTFVCLFLWFHTICSNTSRYIIIVFHLVLITADPHLTVSLVRSQLLQFRGLIVFLHLIVQKNVLLLLLLTHVFSCRFFFTA